MPKTKNIIIIGINFYPEDTAIGLYTTQMAQYLVDKGHQVNIITGFPYYPQWKIKEEYRSKPKFYIEEFGKIRIFRYKQFVPNSPSFRNRVFHILDFTFGSLYNCFKINKADLVIAIVPFTSSVLLGWILKKRTKAKLWVHIQDFEFDAAFETGLTRDIFYKNILFKFLFRFEKWLFSRADIASSISFTMLEKLKSKVGVSTEIKYLPNWVEVEKEKTKVVRKHPYLSSDKFKILYSGNIGDKQDWKLFLNFAKALDGRFYEIIVVGNGSMKTQLVNDTESLGFVHHYEPVPYEELGVLLRSADLHILFQKESVKDTVMPSKLLGMMRSGVPSLVTGNPDSEVRRIIEESSGGYYLYNHDLDALVRLVDDIFHKKEEQVIVGLNGKKYVENNFSKQKILDKAFERLD
ncbi:WcaI family glycosyltransferase [Flagellimonas crocea]|uniref:WcaI family glycosyltransferase n=1 Tax=Flagellimonas crocea TaxID=3067311 RepID=UPI00296E6D1A|nr:WcaI family glycosyltransferase [Muricauda sp. DH64]